MSPAQLLVLLREAKVMVAHEALASPAGQDAFAYGRAVGVYAGMDMAESLLVGLIDDRDRKDRDL